MNFGEYRKLFVPEPYWNTRSQSPMAARLHPAASVGLDMTRAAGRRDSPKSLGARVAGESSRQAVRGNHGHFRSCQCRTTPPVKGDRTGARELQELWDILDVGYCASHNTELFSKTKFFTREKLWSGRKYPSCIIMCVMQIFSLALE